MRRFGLMITVAVCSLTAGLRGDAVILHNGQRIEGEILGGTANVIHLRRANDAGGKSVEVIDRANISRIERASKGPASRPANPEPRPALAVPTTRPDPVRRIDAPVTSRPAVELTHDTHRALIIAIAKWRAEDFTGAGLDLSRIINSASPDQREAISAITQATVHRTLAELAAEIHLRGAVANRRGAAIRLPYVTEYEKSALIPMLVNAYEATLSSRDEELKIDFDAASPSEPPEPARRAGPSPDRGTPPSGKSQPWYAAYAQSRPASAPEDDPGPTLAVRDLLDHPDLFEGSASEAKAVAPRLHQALSLLNERIRLDPALRRNADLKRRLLADKQALVQLAKTLETRPGRSAPKPPPDPEAAAADQARREEVAKRMQEAQQAEAKKIADAQEAARKWQQDQEKQQQKGFSLFDWLKPSGQNQTAPINSAPGTETKTPSNAK